MILSADLDYSHLGVNLVVLCYQLFPYYVGEIFGVCR